jgi:cbb3-type cytochrome oxidase subunit 3
MWDLLWFVLLLIFSEEARIIFLIILGLFLIGGIYLRYLSKKEKSIAEQTPSFPTYEDSISSTKQIVMEQAPPKQTNQDIIGSAKQTVREKALEIKDKMSKITGHLSIIKDMNTRDAKEIYDKEKNILTGLFDYYCKFQKVYSDLSFSQILNPVDITAIKKLNELHI